MSERDKIAERLRKKEQEIQTLEEKLRAARVYVQALQDVLKMLNDGPEASSSEVALKPGSAVAQAREIILQRGSPVHISDLLVALGRESNRDSRASLTSSLAAYVRRGDIFTRPAPNTFGLVELGHGAARSEATTEPPPDFGMDQKKAPESQSKF
jgi:hypothetical protein